jgi:hypothetical protein
MEHPVQLSDMSVYQLLYIPRQELDEESVLEAKGNVFPHTVKGLSSAEASL